MKQYSNAIYSCILRYLLIALARRLYHHGTNHYKSAFNLQAIASSCFVLCPTCGHSRNMQNSFVSVSSVAKRKDTKCNRFCTNHVTEGHAQGGKACFYTHFGGAKVLFPYINIQVTDFVGGLNNAKLFYWAQCLPAPPVGTCLQQPS